MKFLQKLYRRAVHGKPIIVVSGLPRSGTSMIMKMLEAGGLPLVMDGLRKADEDNPKGYFELERVKSLATQSDKSWLVEARGKAIKVISYLLKDLPPTDNYKVLFVRRNLQEVLASQNKMLAHRGESTPTNDTRMRELFENEIWKSLSLLKRAPHFEVLELQYKDVLDQPLDNAFRIRDFLGIGLDTNRMATVVDRQLYRNRLQNDRSEAGADPPANQ
jgi:hypothetical protein